MAIDQIHVVKGESRGRLVRLDTAGNIFIGNFQVSRKELALVLLSFL